MSENQDSSQTRAKRYFIAAVSLLFVLALVWSVDASIVYLLLGAIVFLTYLGLRAWPWKQRQSFSGGYEQSRRTAGSARPRYHTTSSTSSSSTSVVPSKSRVIFFVVGMFVFCFGLLT